MVVGYAHEYATVWGLGVEYGLVLWIWVRIRIRIRMMLGWGGVGVGWGGGDIVVGDG